MAASFTAIIGVVGSGGIDIAQYTRVAPGEGLDPANSGYLEPAFAESPLRDGGPLINIDAKNREMIFPVAFSSTTKDGLHALIQQVNNAFQTQTTFTWQDQGASNPTILDLQTGRVDVEYNFRRAQKFWCFATVHVWTSPYGGTGTQRLIGSTTSSGIAQQFTLASLVLGDSPAKARWEVVTGSQVADPNTMMGRWVGVAALPASYVPVWSAASIGGPTGALIAASGAQGSQMWSPSVVATLGQDQVMGQVQLNSQVYAGRNRVFAVARSRTENNQAIYGQDWEGNRIAATVLASGVRDWHLYDLGVMNVPTSGVPSLIPFKVVGNAHLGPVPVSGVFFQNPFRLGSSPFDLNQLIIVPEAQSALLTDDVDMPSQLVYDNFNNGATSAAMLAHITDTGNSWASSFIASVAGYGNPNFNMSVGNGVGGQLTVFSPFTSDSATGAIEVVRIPSILQGDMRLSMGFSVAGVLGTVTAWQTPSSGLHVGKEVSSIGFYRARMMFGTAPCFNIEYSEAGAVPTYIGCQAVNPSVAPNARLKMVCQFSGPTISAKLMWDDAVASQPVLATAALSNLGATLFQFRGDPQFAWRSDASQWVGPSGVGQSTFTTPVFDFRVESVPTQRVAPRDVYVFDGINGEAYRRPLNGDIQQRLTHKLRGAIPKVPQGTQTSKIVGFALGLPEGVASDVTDVGVFVREQFRFAR